MRELSYPFRWKFESWRYSALYLMERKFEDQVQRDILELLHFYLVDACAIDAGGRRTRGRLMGAAAKSGVDLGGLQNLKNTGEIPAGFADLHATLAPSGRSLYIEVKAPQWLDTNKRPLRRAGMPTEDQLHFLESKHRRGALAFVAWSVKDVEGEMGPLLMANREALRR